MPPFRVGPVDSGNPLAWDRLIQLSRRGCSPVVRPWGMVTSEERTRPDPALQVRAVQQLEPTEHRGQIQTNFGGVASGCGREYAVDLLGLGRGRSWQYLIRTRPKQRRKFYALSPSNQSPQAEARHRVSRADEVEGRSEDDEPQAARRSQPQRGGQVVGTAAAFAVLVLQFSRSSEKTHASRRSPRLG